MKKIKNLAILLCALLAFSSCQEWLTIQPETQVTKDEMFKTQAGFYDALMGCYTVMRDNYSPDGGMVVGAVELMANLWNVTVDGGTSYELTTHNYREDLVDNMLGALFMQQYEVIANLNLLLEYMETQDGVLSSDEYTMYKGEALALRAFIHFDLIRLWGPMPTNVDESYYYLPYVTKVSKSSSDYNTYEEYMNLLLKDLEEAENLLRTSDPIMFYTNEELNTTSMFGEYDRTEYYYRQNRMNYYGACALHARVALWMNDQETAVAYADSVINAKNADGSLKFTLGTADDISANTSDGAQSNNNTLHSEHLFSRYYSYYNWQQYWSTIQDNKHYFDWSKISTLFGGDKNDFRFGKLCFQPDGEGSTYGTSLKYMCYDDLWVPLIRLSEMYFIVMECGSLARANELYTEFCASRGCTYTELTDANRQSIILQEYYKEFLAEGQVFFANKRLAVERPLWVEDEMREEQYVLPLPERESNLQ